MCYQRTGPLLATFGSLLLWASCGGGGGPPDAGPADTGAAVDAGDAGGDAGLPALSWEPCPGVERFECASLLVPVDHGAPDGPTMTLALTRWPALAPADRLGVLVYAAGAGASGVQGAQDLPSWILPAMGEVLRRFDVIGIDIRGTGGSVPRLDCLDDAARGTLLSELEGAADDAAAEAVIRGVIEGCRSRSGVDSLAPFDTVSSARDVELLRRALGVEELSLLGFSYGTWLTTVYTSLYPERVRAAVLASAMPASNDTFDRIENQIRGAEAAIGAFFAWCDATPSCAFRPTSGTTREAFDALVASLVAAPLGALDRATVRNTLFKSLYLERYADLATMLEAAEGGDPGPLLAAAALLAPAEGMEWHFVHRALDETLAPGATIEDFRARLATVRGEAPSFGALWSDQDVFVWGALAWSEPPAEPFAVAPIRTAPPLLFLAGRHDPVTPVEGSLTLLDAFDNGSAMIQTQVIGHLTLHGGCGREHGAAYLVDPGSVATLAPLVECPAVSRDEPVVGSLTEALTWDRNSNRTGETALGDLVADALRAATGADLALVNGGGIRAGLPANGVLPADTALRRPGAGYAAGPPFDIVFEDLRAVFPFGNRALTAAVTGAQLHAFLEHALAEYTGPAAGTGSFVQISGFRMVFDGAAAPGARVVSLSLEDGTPIPDEATASYTLSLPDYVWYGGTGHYGLVEASTAPPTVGAPLEEVLADYFQAQGEVTAATDGRIEIR